MKAENTESDLKPGILFERLAAMWYKSFMTSRFLFKWKASG